MLRIRRDQLTYSFSAASVPVATIDLLSSRARGGPDAAAYVRFPLARSS